MRRDANGIDSTAAGRTTRQTTRRVGLMGLAPCLRNGNRTFNSSRTYTVREFTARTHDWQDPCAPLPKIYQPVVRAISIEHKGQEKVKGSAVLKGLPSSRSNLGAARRDTVRYAARSLLGTGPYLFGGVPKAVEIVVAFGWSPDSSRFFSPVSSHATTKALSELFSTTGTPASIFS